MSSSEKSSFHSTQAKGSLPLSKGSKAPSENSASEPPNSCSDMRNSSNASVSDATKKFNQSKEPEFYSEKNEKNSSALDHVLPNMLNLGIDEKNALNPPGAPRLSYQVEDSEVASGFSSNAHNSLEDFPPKAKNEDSTSSRAQSNSAMSREDSQSSSRFAPVDEIADSLIDIMAPVVYEMDDRILAVKESQLQLQNLIKRLLEELNSYVDLAHPPKLQGSINKLVGARRRLISINTILNNVQGRLDEIYSFMQGNV